MSVLEQPSPEAWDDELSGNSGQHEASAETEDEPHDEPDATVTEPEPTQAIDTEMSSESTTGGEYVSADSMSEESSTGVPVETSAPAVAEDGATFLAELARAMAKAAETEKSRSAEENEQRREAQVAAIRAQAAQDAAGLGERAEQDIAEIGAWADAETDRIRLEREARVATRREALQHRLDEHQALTERQVEAIDAALAEYRFQLDAFFAHFDGEQDPESIARFARTRPSFPELEAVAERARIAATADATTADEATQAVTPDTTPADQTVAVEWGSGEEAQREPGLVGVMDASSEGQVADTPWTAPPQAEEAESSGVTARSSGALLGTVPARRPISSWLNRNRERESPDAPED